MVPMKPLHDKYGIKRVVYSTYQAVSGSGIKGIKDLEEGLKGNDIMVAYPHPIAGNCLPQIDVFLDNGYTKEEMKMIDETHKILGDDNIRVTATTVRVPVFSCHSESINLEFEKPFDIEEVKRFSPPRRMQSGRAISKTASTLSPVILQAKMKSMSAE